MNKIKGSKNIEELYSAIGSPLGAINWYDVKQIIKYVVLYVIYQLSIMLLDKINIINLGEFMWIKEPIIFIFTLLTKKILNNGNIFLKK